MILKIFGSAHSPFVKTFYRTSKRGRIQSPGTIRIVINWCHQARESEGEAHGCADINAAQDVQALIAEGQDANSNLIGYRTFFSLVFFVHAKKSNSPL